MFESARLKLTAWYLLLIMLVSCFFSCFIYLSVNTEFQRFEQIDKIIQERSLQGLPIPLSLLKSHVEPELILEARARLVGTLSIINFAIFLAAGLIGYFLAGRTLKPIKNMVDEQNRFITDASHELRTPLTSLRSEIEVSMLNNSLSLPEAKKLIKSNLEEVVRLQSLSDNLLELTHYEKLMDRRKFQQVSLKEIIAISLKNVSGQSKKNKIVMKTSLSDGRIEGSPIALTELFTILLDNAIKYSNKGGAITIEMKTHEKNICISIQDEGVGIESKDLPYIFDRFYRADKSRSKQIDGFGLGLAIAHKIVMQHKGTIKVKSLLNNGTIFTVTFPRIK